MTATINDTCTQLASELTQLQAQLLELSCEKESTSAVSERMLQYNELLNRLMLWVGQQHRGASVAVKNGEVRVQREYSTQDSALLVEHVSRVVYFVDFIKGFEESFRSKQLDVHADFRARLKALQKDRILEHRSSLGQNSSRAEDPQPIVNGEDSVKGKLLSTNRKITSNLLRSNQILQSSVLQSDLNLNDLQAQTHSLTGLNDKFDQLGTVLTKSARMIKIIESSSGREKRDIYLGLGFLILCMAWVLWRRVLKTPAKLALWLWFKFFKMILVSMGAVSSVVERASSSVPAETTPELTTGLTEHVAATATATETIKHATDAATDLVQRILTTEAVERAVDSAMGRIMDEL